MNKNRTIYYNIPDGMTVEIVAINMIEEVKRWEDGKGPHIMVQAVHNGIPIWATSFSTAEEIIERWDREKITRELRNQRLDPIRTAIRYLLSTLSTEDCAVLTEELASNSVRSNISP